ncbi:MAG TPA: formyltransferase family protein [Vicinamibacterales bacterium]|nr:formyltransferase family protein [Vicinamibacterales bacterium]
MKIAVIGRTSILYDTAIALRSAGHSIVCVITSPAAPEYTRTEDDFRQLAESFDAPFFCAAPGLRPDFDRLCRGADVAVSVNWTSIFSSRQIELFRIGILNTHHGDLPRYRGNACANWAILRGETSITATVHLVEGGRLDCGRVVAQERYPLTARTTVGDVYDWSDRSTPALLMRAIEALEKDPAFTVKVARLEDVESFRCYPRMPEDMYIAWDRPPSEVDALVRASSRPFAGAYTFHWENTTVKKLRVLAARVVSESTKDVAAPGQILHNDRDTGETFVRCGPGVLALVSCRYDDEAGEFAPGRRWTSIRMRLGVRAEDWLWQLAQQR